MGAPKLLMIELLKKNVNLKIPLDLLARGIKLAIITGENKRMDRNDLREIGR